MKKLKVFLLVFSVLTVSLLFSSCTAKITADEIAAVLPSLIDLSKPLNEIYFGEGFEVDGNISNVAKNGGYFYCDTEKYGLNSILEIKEASEKVFTAEYAAILYEDAFEGTSTDISVEGARFIEGEMGLMQKANSTVYEICDREFDYGSIKVIKSTKDRATVKINSVANGKEEPIEIIVVRYIDTFAPIVTDEGGKIVPTYYYRLDSPTY